MGTINRSIGQLLGEWGQDHALSVALVTGIGFILVVVAYSLF